MKRTTRYLLLALSLAAALGTGGRMYWLWQEEQLWGHLPLFFFVAVWTSIVLLFWKRYTRPPKGLRWLGLSTLSGVLLSVGFPPIPLTLLMFIGWVPLLLVEHEIAREKQAPSTPQSFNPSIFLYAYNTFVIWNVLTTWWVGNTAFIAGIVAIWLNAFFMSVPFLLFSRTKRVLPRLGYAAFIVYWISFEMLHLHWEISWSWLNLGNAFARFPAWVQWYEYTGVFGGTLWILLANVLVFKLLKNAPSPAQIWQRQKIDLLKIAAFVLVPIFISWNMYAGLTDKGKEVEVVVIQPNFEPHYEKFNVPLQEQIERFITLSKSALTENTEYLVFPETSFNAHNVPDLERDKTVRRLEDFLKNYPKLKLVTGVAAYKIFRPGESHTHTTRTQISGQDTLYWEAYNGAIQLENGAGPIPFYIKSKLVPGAEVLPYHEVLFFLKPLADKLGGSVEGLGTQPEREAFASNSGKVAPVICYESVFGEYHAGYVRAGANATFIMTNDGWWDNTAGHKQHLEFASLRAIETRRSIARSANTGISCFLNQRGDILQPTIYGEAAAIRGTIKFNDEITFYVRWGDLIGRVAVLMTAILLLNALVRGYLQKVKAPE
ncbi:MAG: apolipoprotein N-acyltransferase [Saprospiraceae bacterium]